MDELLAFTSECRAAEATLTEVGLDAWAGPGLGEWTLHELGAHLVGAAARLAEYAAEPVAGPEPVCDRVGYWRMDLRAQAPAIAARARDRAVALPAEDVAAAFGSAWRATAEVVTARDPAALVTTLRGPMRVDEYLATRVLEVCVHHIDVRAALELPPAATPEASKLTMAMLEGLLDGPRPRNLGRTRFILAATGRIPSDDPRLPVLT